MIRRSVVRALLAVVGAFDLVATAFAGSAGATAGSAERLSPVLLDTLGGASVAVGLNNLDQVVGYSYFPGPGQHYHAVVWQHGVLRDLGSLYGPSGNSSASAINDLGQVVGFSSTATGGTLPYLYSHGTMTAIGPLNTVPTDINDLGQIIGYSGGSGGFTPEVWLHGTITALPTVPGCDFTLPVANNLRGQIVGTCRTNTGPHTVLWDPGYRTVRDLGGTLVAEDINDLGWIVGTDPATHHAVLWQPAAGGGWTVTDLGTLPIAGASSAAYSVNDRGQVAGTSGNGSFGQAFRWQRGSLTGLEPPAGTQLGSGQAVNLWGHVAGTVYDQASPFTPRAVLWH